MLSLQTFAFAPRTIIPTVFSNVATLLCVYLCAQFCFLTVLPVELCELVQKIECILGLGDAWLFEYATTTVKEQIQVTIRHCIHLNY